MPALTLDEARALAREWCEYATNGADGRRVDDPVYRWVTEGRDPGPGYSSCADLAHWLLTRLGVQAAWLNRDEGDDAKWRSVVNVGRLCASPVGGNPVARKPEPGELFRTGDVLICWKRPDTRDAHVMVCARHEGGRLVTWDYGQGPMGVEPWRASRAHVEAAKRTREVFERDGRWTFMTGKSIRSVLPLADVLAACPLRAPDRPTGEFLEALGLPLDFPPETPA